MLAKAQTLQVDTVCMDLEDAVAENQKGEARRNIVHALNEWPNAQAERLGQSRVTPSRRPVKLTHHHVKMDSRSHMLRHRCVLLLCSLSVRINPIGSGFEEQDLETVS
jgi:citrate lyase beta subunit